MFKDDPKWPFGRLRKPYRAPPVKRKDRVPDLPPAPF